MEKDPDQGGFVGKFLGTGQERDRNISAVTLLVFVLLFAALSFAGKQEAAEATTYFIVFILGNFFKSSKE